MNVLNKGFRLNIKNYLIFLLIYILIYFSEINNINQLPYFIFFAGILIIFINRKLGFLIYLFAFFIFDDYPLDLQYLESFSTLDGETIFGQTLTKIWSLFLLPFLIHEALKKRISLKKDNFLKVINLIFLYSIINGIFQNGEHFNYIINDIRFFLNLYIGYFGVRLYLNNFYELEKISNILALILLAKLTVLVPASIILHYQNDFFVAVGDSGFIFAPSILILFYINTQKNKTLLLYIAIFLCLISFFIIVSRGKIILLITQIFLFFYIIRQLNKLRILIFPLLLISYLIIFYLNDTSILSALEWKLQSFSLNSHSSQSTTIRAVEFTNIFYQNLNSFYEFIFGQGLGGSWNSIYSQYPFELFDTFSYPDEWIFNDEFFKPHGILLFILLKFGFLGFLLVYSTLLYLIFKSRTVFLKKYRMNKNVILMYSWSLTTVVSLFLICYSSKHQLFLGVFLGFFYLFRSHSIKKYKV